MNLSYRAAARIAGRAEARAVAARAERDTAVCAVDQVDQATDPAGLRAAWFAIEAVTRADAATDEAYAAARAVVIRGLPRLARRPARTRGPRRARRAQAAATADEPPAPPSPRDGRSPSGRLS